MRYLTTSDEFDRPANATAYAAKDVVTTSTSAGRVLTFAGAAGYPGGGGDIIKARLMTNLKTCVSRFRLHLYHTAPTVINDADPMLLLYTDRAKRIGYIDFPACSSEDSTNSDAAQAIALGVSANLPLPFNPIAAGQALYGVLETLDAFTPGSTQKFYVELTIQPAA